LGFAIWSLELLKITKYKIQEPNWDFRFGHWNLNLNIMARIAGIDLPKNKRGEIGLTYIYGIGKSTARYILEKANVDYDKKVNQWDDEEQTAIRNIISGEFKTEGALRSEVQTNIKRLLDIACYRGLRHRKGLPLRGQRTRTNSRTRKGKRKTVAGKKKAPKK